MTRNTKTNDGLEILHKLFFAGKPEAKKVVQQEREKAEVARMIYNMRNKAGLTQKQLATRIGTTQSVISRLEDADYRGHSFEMLRRIAEALSCRVEIRIVSIKRRTRAS
jgi:ribosome-binding protein aMBF1 (putative translation factor)